MCARAYTCAHTHTHTHTHTVSDTTDDRRQQGEDIRPVRDVFKAKVRALCRDLAFWRQEQSCVQTVIHHVDLRRCIKRIHNQKDTRRAYGSHARVDVSHVTSRVNESCHLWMSHVTHAWIMSRVNESCHICMSHVAYEYVMRAWVIYIYMYGAYIVCIPEVCTYVYIHMYISNEFTTRKTHGAHIVHTYIHVRGEIVCIVEVCTYIYIHMCISNEFTTWKTHGAHMGLT